MSESWEQQRKAWRLTAPHLLYRLFDEDGALLYVGITMKGTEGREGRSIGHRSASWWPLVRRHSLEPYPDRATAEAAERAAIETEYPRFNRAPGIVLNDVIEDDETWNAFRAVAMRRGHSRSQALLKAVRAYLSDR